MQTNVPIVLMQQMRAGMWAPGLTGLAVGLILLFVVRDSPEQVGFPPVEVVEKAKPKEDGSAAPKESLLTLLVNNVLKNPFIWGMALTYFFIYVVRQGVTSWFVFYLIKVRARPLPSSNPCSSSAARQAGSVHQFNNGTRMGKSVGAFPVQ